MQVKINRWAIFVLPILLLVALCVPFMNNPLVFDDMYFFMPGNPEKFLASGFHLWPRWWVEQTLALTFSYVGPEVVWFRIGNLAIHLGAAIALFFLVRRLLIDLDSGGSSTLSPETAALVAATLFALHPLAIFAQGYLIERTILCATLFALLCMLLFWHGLKGSRMALWSSCIAFAVAVFAKELAIMVPAVCFLLLVLFMRSGMKLRLKLPEVLSALFLLGLISICVVLMSKGILGTAYEPMVAEMMDDMLSIPRELIYPLSVMNQGGLYFKYLLLWILPNSSWISLDMREAFPLNFQSWTLWGGFLLYLAYGAVAARLLFKGGRTGLAGLALLSSWVLFFTELSTARLQEPFVLYRSYLWMPLLFTLIALVVRKLRTKAVFAYAAVFIVFYTGLSFVRLTVLSSQYLVWDEAARLIEKKDSMVGVLGAYRIYYNRGNALYEAQIPEQAMEDFDRSLKLKPNYGHAYHQRGVIYLDRHEWDNARINFEKAMFLLPKYTLSYLGRGLALEKLGNMKQANETFKAACDLGSKRGCDKLGINPDNNPAD